MPKLLVIVLILIMVFYLNRSYASIYSQINSANLPNPTIQRVTIFKGHGQNAIKLVTLGDSLTSGVGTDNIANSYPYLVAGQLATKNHFVALVNLSHPGATTREVLETQVKPALAERPDLITLLIGVNDIHNLVSPSKFEANYRDILEGLAGSHAKVVVINIPYLGSGSLIHFPYNLLLNLRTKQFNGIIARLSAQKNVQYIDLYGQSYASFQNDNSYYARDLFHPSTKGYALWGKLINDSLNF